MVVKLVYETFGPAGLILNPPLSRLIQYCTNTKDFMVPSMWGSVSEDDASMVSTRCVGRYMRARYSWADRSSSRSTSARIHMHRNNQTVVALLCEIFDST